MTERLAAIEEGQRRIEQKLDDLLGLLRAGAESELLETDEDPIREAFERLHERQRRRRG